MEHAFFEKGWRHFSYDRALAAWVSQTLPTAREAVAAPENSHWLRCGGTWFAGVNVLPNDAQGAVRNGTEIVGKVVDFIHDVLKLKHFAWDRAQVSVCYPGYPKPMARESEAAYRYRRDRDAAHVDGLVREGQRRRRHLREHHGFLLGIPMIETNAGASPFVIWEGSHEVIRKAFAAQFKCMPPERWDEVDVTEIYHAARRKIFDTCRRTEIVARPGEAFLVHRFALHGTARWRDTEHAGPDGRMIVYFRPEIGASGDWLNAP
ncbi:MAG: hypothetical protein ACR2PO_09345 [Methyloligellaceae bacterium]